MKTAEEFLMQNTDIMTMAGNKQKVIKALIEFAKMHVKSALESAHEGASIINTEWCPVYGSYGNEIPSNIIVDKESIIESYPLENIK